MHRFRPTSWEFTLQFKCRLRAGTDLKRTLAMTDFLTNLVDSIFTPGPTPTLIVATNVSFAALQLVLLALLVATYSVHFLVLSFLSAGLWWAINWFAKEVREANTKGEEAQRLEGSGKEKDSKGTEDSDTETEGQEGLGQENESSKHGGGFLRPGRDGESLRKRPSLGESGEISTDSEWDKVSAEGDKD